MFVAGWQHAKTPMPVLWMCPLILAEMVSHSLCARQAYPRKRGLRILLSSRSAAEACSWHAVAVPECLCADGLKAAQKVFATKVICMHPPSLWAIVFHCW